MFTNGLHLLQCVCTPDYTATVRRKRNLSLCPPEYSKFIAACKLEEGPQGQGRRSGGLEPHSS